MISYVAKHLSKRITGRQIPSGVFAVLVALGSVESVSASAQAIAGETYGAQNRDSRVVIRARSDVHVVVRSADGTLHLNRVLGPGDSYRVPNSTGLYMIATDIRSVLFVVDGELRGPAATDQRTSSQISLEPASLISQYRPITDFAIATEDYPATKTEPLVVFGKPEYTKQLPRLVETVQKELSRRANQSVQIQSIYFLKQAGDTPNPVLCGQAIIPLQTAQFRFVGLVDRPYWNVTDDGWRKMGCETPGGSNASVIQEQNGKVSLKIAAPASKAASNSRENTPAKPPSTLPPGFRQRLAFDQEDRLSQIFGAQVSLTSLRMYDEHDGSTTTCTVGLVGGKRFRLAVNKEVLGDPSQKQWVEAGCTRPNYQLIR